MSRDNPWDRHDLLRCMNVLNDLLDGWISINRIPQILVQDLYGIAWALKHDALNVLKKRFSKNYKYHDYDISFTRILMEINPELEYDPFITWQGMFIGAVWIHRTHADMPEWMRINPALPDNSLFKQIISVHWFIAKNSEPPEWMRVDPKIIDKYGWTLAMYWIYYKKESPPLYMRHGLDIYDEDNWNLETYWNERVKSPLPKWLSDLKAADKNKNKIPDSMPQIFYFDKPCTPKRYIDDEPIKINHINTSDKCIRFASDKCICSASEKSVKFEPKKRNEKTKLPSLEIKKR